MKKKNKTILIVFMLITMSFSSLYLPAKGDVIYEYCEYTSNYIEPASEDNTEFEIVPNSEHLYNQSSIKVGIYITPQDGKVIDALSIDLLTFSKDSLQAVSVEKGNFFEEGGMESFSGGSINNNEGKITYIFWTVQEAAVSDPGYFVNITFNIVKMGSAWIKLDQIMAGYMLEELNSTVKNNYTLFAYDIIVGNEYPQNNSRGLNRTEVFSIDVLDGGGDPLDVFWYTNMTGETRLLGYNISTYDGKKQMSCYGVVESPYNQSIVYQFEDRLNGIFKNNTGPGKDIGAIRKVEIYAPSFSGTAIPYFDGDRKGESYAISSEYEYRADITDDLFAPTEWNWKDIKNLDVKISDVPTYIVITYDIRYGYGETVYWTVNVTDGEHWVNNSYNYQITTQLPIIINHQPGDAETVHYRNLQLSAELIDFQGDQMDISFWSNKSGSWQQVGLTQNGYNGTYYQDIEVSEFSKWYWWKVVAVDNGNSTERFFRFKTRDIYKPAEPKDFSVIANNETKITMSWQIDENTDHTLIKKRTDRYPEFEDPGQVYYGNETEYLDEICNPGTFYFYRAWNYNETDDVWSDVETENCSNATITYPNSPTNLHAETLAYNQISLTWDVGDGATKTVIRRKTGSYPSNYNDGTLVYDGVGGSHIDDMSMGGNITYYYRAWSYATSNSVYKYSLSYSSDSNTTEVGPPTVVTNPITYVDINDITLNGYLVSDGGEAATCGFKWGNSTASYNVTIGTRATGISFTYKLPSLTYAKEYYMQAWAFNSYGYVEGINETFCTPPKELTNFNVETVDYKSINIEWDNNEGSDKTLIKVKEDSYPTSPTDGETIYFGEGDSFLLEGLTESDPELTEYHDGLHQMVYPLCGGTGTPYYNDRQIYGLTGGAQTFTIGYRGTNEYYYLRSISLRLWRTGNPGPVVAMISNATKVENARVTSGYLINPSWGNAYDIVYPATQYILAEATIDGYTIPSTATPGDWVEFIFNEPVIMKKGEVYTISLKAAWGTASDCISWVKDSVYSNHGGGDCFISTNGGSSWSEIYYQYSGTWGYQYGRADFGYRCYGNELAGLVSNKTYYFSAWSYNNTQGLYSETYKSDINTTDIGKPRIAETGVTNITDSTADLNAFIIFDNGELSTAGFIYGESPNNLNQNVTCSGTWPNQSDVTRTISGLSKGTTYHYKAWVRNSAGYYYDYKIGHFHTKPQETNSLSSSPWGADQINITWNKGSGGDITIVVRKTGSYPTNMTDGVERYRGEDNYFIDHFTNEEGEPIVEPMFQNTNYYYRVWTYNESNNHYSTSYEQTTSKTQLPPTISDRSPEDYSVNINVPPNLSTKASSSYEPINVTFWLPHSLNMDDKKIADAGSGWSQSDGITNTATGYTSVKKSYCSYDYYYIRNFAYTSKSGYNFIETTKLTAYLDQPKMISGISLSYGKYYSPTGGGSYYLDGTKTWHMEYHDFYNDQWISANDYADWGTNEIYTNDLMVVDQVRIWLRSTSQGTTIIRINPRVNYIYFVAPDELDSEEINSGQTVSIHWDDATEQNERYYWAVTANDGRTITGSSVDYFITETFYFTDHEPQGTVPNTPTHNCRLNIYHSRGDPFNITFYRKVGADWIQENTYSNVYNGSYNFTYNDSGTYGQTYWWKVVAEDGGIQHSEEYSFYVRQSYVPSTPTMTATTQSSGRIDITGISSNSYADSIMLRYKEGSYPADRNDGILLQNSTASSFIHDGLTPGRTYYYAAWAWNMTDNVWSGRKTALASTPGPALTFKTYAIDRNNINITQINANEFSDAVLIRYSSVNHPTTIEDGLLCANISASNTYFIHAGLDEHNQYYYSAWSWNETHNVWSSRYIETVGFLHEGYTTKPGRTRGPVALSNFNPANDQENVPLNPNLQVRAINYESTGPISIYYRTNSSGSWETIGSKIDVEDGTQTISTTHFPEQLKWYWYSINATDGDFWTNQTIKFKTKSVSSPTALVVKTPKIEGQLDITWLNSPEAESTVIIKKLGSYPSSPSDGTQIYNGTATKYNDTGLDNGAVYYYRAWSYLDGRFSTTYASARGLTIPLKPTNIRVETTGYRSIRVSWDKGEGADKTHIMLLEDFYPINTTHGTFVYNETGNYVDISGLKPGDYLNYFTPKGNTNTIGHYYFGRDFSKSYDENALTAWELSPNIAGVFSYIFNVSKYGQEMDALQRIYSFKMLTKDFYDEPGETWNASIDEVETYNGTWNTFWEGRYSCGEHPVWWKENITLDHKGVSEIKFSAWSDYIVADIYEVEIGKLGYTYKFTLWSVAEKEGFIEMSLDTEHGENRTDDNPINIVPEISNMNPPNNSMDVEHKPAMLNVTINDKEGHTMSIRWMTNKSGPWEVFHTSSGLSNGTYSLPTYIFDEYETDYWWKVNVSDNSDSMDSVYSTHFNHSEIYNFATRQEIKPQPPDNFKAEKHEIRNIKLTWIMGENSDNTYIVMKQGSYPSNRNDGENIYNGTGASHIIYDLEAEKTYYFRAWGWNQTDVRFSDTYSQNYTTTGDNQKPVLSSENPENGTSGVSRYLTQVQITIYDADNDDMDCYIYGEYVDDAEHIGQTGGVKSAPLLFPLPGSTIITWNVAVYDGYGWTNETYSFTTEGNSPPIQSLEDPENKSTEISLSYSHVKINITDPDGNPMDWKIHGNYVTYTQTFDDVNGTKQAELNTPLPPSTNITWFVNVTDGEYWINRTYWFITSGNSPPNTPTNGYATARDTTDETYMNVYDVWLNCTVSDPDGNAMDVYFYWGNDTLIGVIYGVANNTEASLYLPDHWSRMIGEYEVTWLEHDTTYEWYAIADDGSLESTKSETFDFKTCVAFDLNIDGIMNVLDISGVVSRYGKKCVPGQIPADVNEDGTVNVLDISGVVSRYGKKYK